MAAASVAMLAGCPSPAQAQRLPTGDVWEDYLRILQVAGLARAGSFTVRPVALGAAVAVVGEVTAHPWKGRWTLPAHRALGHGVGVTPADPGIRLFANTAFADGQNDGPVWQGKGLTAAVDAGVTLSVGPLSVTAHPILIHARNADFGLAGVLPEGLPEYGYPWRRIDLPQRFGPDPFTQLDPGGSSLRLDFRGASLGVGTESLWWGPGIRNAIVLSDNAGGFPHAFVGTRGPVDTRIGTLEAQWIFGRLQLSEWYDTAYVDPGRFATGAVVAFTPRVLAGLTLGVSRMFYALVPERGVGARDFLLVFQGTSKEAFATPENPAGEDAHDQLFSAFARWVLPESGFETWVEWARNDHGWNLRDYLVEPEHAQAYTLGFRKVMLLSGDRLLSFHGELSHLDRSATVRARVVPTYYIHHIVTPGYTQRGQVLGAGIGPGGSAQYLATDLYAAWGRAGVFFQRRVHDNDAYYDLMAPTKTWCCHHVSVDLGGVGTFWAGEVEMSVEGTLTRDLNRYFIEKNDIWNANVQLSARWRPR